MDDNFLCNIADPKAILIEAAQYGMLELVKELVTWEEADIETCTKAIYVAKDHHIVAILLHDLLGMMLEDMDKIDDIELPLLTMRDHMIPTEPEADSETESTQTE